MKIYLYLNRRVLMCENDCKNEIYITLIHIYNLSTPPYNDIITINDDIHYGEEFLCQQLMKKNVTRK